MFLKKQISAILAICLCVLTYFALPVCASGTLSIRANADGKVYPASMVKLMTALVALERGDLAEEVKVTKRAINSVAPGSVSANAPSFSPFASGTTYFCFCSSVP